MGLFGDPDPNAVITIEAIDRMIERFYEEFPHQIGWVTPRVKGKGSENSDDPRQTDIEDLGI